MVLVGVPYDDIPRLSVEQKFILALFIHIVFWGEGVSIKQTTEKNRETPQKLIKD